MLSISGLGFSYAKTPILSDIDLTVAPGEIVALIGPNGAGKSTLIKCCNRILRANPGSVALAGKPLESYDRRALARTVSYVPQHAVFGMSMRVFEMVALGRYPHRGLAGKARDREIVAGAIERLGLTPFSLRRLSELSGGERQRVLIARAVAGRTNDVAGRADEQSRPPIINWKRSPCCERLSRNGTSPRLSCCTICRWQRAPPIVWC